MPMLATMSGPTICPCSPCSTGGTDCQWISDLPVGLRCLPLRGAWAWAYPSCSCHTGRTSRGSALNRNRGVTKRRFAGSPQTGQSAGSDASAIGRSTSKTHSHTSHEKSYSGIRPRLRADPATPENRQVVDLGSEAIAFQRRFPDRFEHIVIEIDDRAAVVTNKVMVPFRFEHLIAAHTSAEIGFGDHPLVAKELQGAVDGRAIDLR